MLFNNLKMLYDFQETETRKEKLESEIKEHPGRKELRQLRMQIEQLEFAYNKKCQTKTELKKRLNMAELKSKELDSEIRALEERIYSGEVQTVKELNKLQTKQDNLKKMLDQVDSDALNLMQQLEDLIQSIPKEKQMITKLKREHNEKRLKVKQELDKINEEIAHLSVKVKEYKSKIPNDIMAKYLKIKENKRQPICLIVDGKCNGCRTYVSVMVAQEVNRHEKIVYCESCGRILI